MNCKWENLLGNILVSLWCANFCTYMEPVVQIWIVCAKRGGARFCSVPKSVNRKQIMLLIANRGMENFNRTESPIGIANKQWKIGETRLQSTPIFYLPMSAESVVFESAPHLVHGGWEKSRAASPLPREGAASLWPRFVLCGRTVT